MKRRGVATAVSILVAAAMVGYLALQWDLLAALRAISPWMGIAIILVALLGLLIQSPQFRAAIRIHKIEMSLRESIALVDVWHGVGFKALGSSYGARMARYHSVIASSPWDAENQVHTAGMGDHQVEPLGYCLMDTIVAAQRSPSGTEYQSRPKLLVAPTWSHGVTDNFDELAGQRVVNALGTWADTRGWDIVIRAHLNASAGFQIADNVRFMPMESFSDTVSLMIESDVLVTDWSSIATDFYGLGRPVVFCDRPCPFDALRMTPEDRAGPIVDSVDELVAVLDVIASDSDWFSTKYGSRQRELVERFHGSGLDGGAGARVVEFLSAVAFV